ncbi:RidA family protein [Sporomusa acidovorans]|uniref:2-iminobutanoate/2-iminopropanoate deaminase n=1 Tax=Sporomusa acidovorans (strain ATCC 49682 / DSM 3132 / Mol) TaxID=1123286 RepID=A0ABZ3J6U6_SPOA4|nr:RidA family protein [Sporomusa acidovorans]OZC18542.1 2-iminobutanoate/2-iminopropanoate deaminase [Sporomusa acidovorans DSM 3132]SDE37939.1 2-iminobutanoate/2-iminopropanoate deaminase [Sporomusa acidovorans]
MKKIINTDKAPSAIGPYSQAIKANGFIFVSGQLPVDPASGRFAEGVAAQTKQSLENVKAILTEADCTFNDVVKATVFIKDMDNFSEVNNVYAAYFTKECPARACIEVARLPKDALIEIEVIAICKQ